MRKNYGNLGPCASSPTGPRVSHVKLRKISFSLVSRVWMWKGQVPIASIVDSGMFYRDLSIQKTPSPHKQRERSGQAFHRLPLNESQCPESPCSVVQRVNSADQMVWSDSQLHVMTLRYCSNDCSKLPQFLVCDMPERCETFFWLAFGCPTPLPDA